MDPVVARKTWRTLEPLHGVIYFAPEASDAGESLGLAGPAWYFASRSAAMGEVRAEVVIATFFNFHPALVRRALAGAWDATTPEAVLAARYDVAARALRRGLGELAESPDLEEVAGLLRRAATAVTELPEGRPLFAAHAALPWPDDPLLVAWHAQTLLREFRGDAHVAALMLDGLTGVEALVMHAATGEIAAAALQTTRAWSDGEWSAAVDGLRAAGAVTVDGDLALTDEGRRRREWVEDATDRASLPAYEAIGEEGCDRLRTIGRPLSKAVVAAGLLNP
jgi:hypothetical protein